MIFKIPTKSAQTPSGQIRIIFHLKWLIKITFHKGFDISFFGSVKRKIRLVNCSSDVKQFSKYNNSKILIDKKFLSCNRRES